MKRTIIASVLLAVLLAACGKLANQSTPAKITLEGTPSAIVEKANRVERGKYLVAGIGCGDCHTPWKMGPKGPEPDTTRLLSGHPEKAPYPSWSPADIRQRHSAASMGLDPTAHAGPWGVSFAANLTPDTTTGIAEWTEETFIRAIRTGKHQGQPNGRDILPPMPWPAFRNLSDDDLKAIWAFLRTINPVKNQVPFPIPPGAPLSMAN